jgi:hypothetical protein
MHPFRRLPSDEFPPKVAKAPKPVVVLRRKGPLVLSHIEPFSLRVTIPPGYVYLNYKTWLRMCTQDRASNPEFRTLETCEFVDEIGEWCHANLTGPWRASRLWPRENGHVFIGLSSWIDVFNFKTQMSEWSQGDPEQD